MWGHGEVIKNENIGPGPGPETGTSRWLRADCNKSGFKVEVAPRMNSQEHRTPFRRTKCFCPEFS